MVFCIFEEICRSKTNAALQANFFSFIHVFHEIRFCPFPSLKKKKKLRFVVFFHCLPLPSNSYDLIQLYLCVSVCCFVGWESLRASIRRTEKLENEDSHHHRWYIAALKQFNNIIGNFFFFLQTKKPFKYYVEKKIIQWFPLVAATTIFDSLVCLFFSPRFLKLLFFL